MSIPAPTNLPVPIVALDVPTLDDAKRLVAQLGAPTDYYKVGLQLFVREGPPVVQWLRGEGKKVFLDLKLHDIPNTVRGAAASAAALGADLLTVHAVGGDEMLRAAVDGAAEGGGEMSVLGVTVLTSFDDASYSTSIGVERLRVAEAVIGFAQRARVSGARGVVCAGAEVGAVRAVCGVDFGTLVPGIRTTGGAKHDQARTSTPAAVRAAGATWVILGRTVTAAADPALAYAEIVRSLMG